MIDAKFRRYLFERHSESEIRSWNHMLRYFRYFRAYGGHANDGDSLDFALRYSETEHLLQIFSILNIPAEIYTAQPPQPVPGQRYRSKDFEHFPSLIKNTRWIKQPGWVEIAGKPAFVWVEEDRIIVSAGPKSYEVDHERVDTAVKIEHRIDFSLLKDLIIDPPKDTPHYISPLNFPELFT